MKKAIQFITVIAVLLPISGCAVLTNVYPSATVRVRIVDDERIPIQGVHCKLFSNSSDRAPPGLTDTNGIYSVVMHKIFADIGGVFQKQSYYNTKGDFWSQNWLPGQIEKAPPAGKVFTIVLKRIVDPVPMYHRLIETYIPKTNGVFGFDLAKGDWVFPDGKGTQADVFFDASLRFESRMDFDTQVSVVFTNELNGIQSFHAQTSYKSNSSMWSELPPPQIAPNDGYEPNISLWKISDGKPRAKTHEKEDRNYIFRTRVVTNEVGEITSANYGWTVGDFIVDPSSRKQLIYLKFRYYYNPDPHSKSLEPKEIADWQNRN